MPKPLAEQVVVITGASSGIGREAALRFAGRGASVVLTARGQEALQEVEREIIAAGGTALVVTADVADFNQVQRVTRSALERFGRIDTWVNNAAVTVYGSFEDTPLEEFRRVLDVNLIGQVNGVRAALPHLKESRGTLIGIGSVLSEVPGPLQTAYTASKHALKGFYDTLRLEQKHANSGVQINFLMLSSINTPLFDHALTHLGVKPAPFPPVYEPEVAANAILFAAQNPLRDVSIGASASGLPALESLSPRAAGSLIERIAYATQFTTEEKAPSGPNNLWHPLPGPGSVRDNFGAVPFDPLTWVGLRPAVKSVLVSVGLAALAIPLAGLILKLAGPPDVD